MLNHKRFFFCGVGGSGMLPLALIMQGRGYEVSGSDRSYDQGRTPEKFQQIAAAGIILRPQDGTGIDATIDRVVISSAVEDTVPDYAQAKALGVPLVLRAELLAQLANMASTSIAIGGTSGKSTTTGMIGYILHHVGQNPTIMNGAIMKNFVQPGTPLASAVVGRTDLFVTETDESDATISLFSPTIAVLTNVAADHKPLPELRELFGSFLQRAEHAIVNLDNPESVALAGHLLPEKVLSFSLQNPQADIYATNIQQTATGSTANIICNFNQQAQAHVLELHVPGAHNIANALAAIAACHAAGVPDTAAIAALASFSGMRRRLELVGSHAGINVIDDFAQNPEKIAASLSTLQQFSHRVITIFQPHGYGMINNHAADFIDCFSAALRPQDILYMPDPLYLGGTVNRELGSQILTSGISATGKQATHIPDRVACAQAAVSLAAAGDQIVIMGARDDSLPQFAREVLRMLKDKTA